MNALPTIPRPMSQHWLDFRFRGLPVFVFLAVLGGIILLWTKYWTGSTFAGEVQSPEAVVSSTAAGLLLDLSVDDYQSVTQKQVLGRVQVESPDRAAAEIAAMKADLQVMRVRMNQDQSRNDLGYQQARVDLQLRRLELASANIRLQQAESEFQRMSELHQAKVVPAGITQARNEFGYDVALRDRDLYRKEVQEKTRLVADLERALEHLLPAQGTNANPAIDAALDAAIETQERVLKQVALVTLRSPIDGVVKRVYRRSGENVAAGEMLVEIGSDKPSRIVGFIRQPIVTRPRVGDSVEVRKRGSRPQVGVAKVFRVGTQLQLFTQPLRVRGFDASMERGLPVLLSVPENLELYPGEAVDLVPKWSR